MVARQRSVPSEAASTTDSSHSQPVSLSTGSSLVACPASHAVPNSRALAHADALAKMTLELNMRSLGAQAQSLERDLQALVLRTSNDAEFRAQHERRLQELWREILAVKTHMSAVQESQEEAKMRSERCQRETSECIQGIRGEMEEYKGIVDSVYSLLDQLPASSEVMETESAYFMPPEPAGVETRGMLRARQMNAPTTHTKPDSPSTHTVASKADPRAAKVAKKQSNPTKTPKARIQEALNSTRRWNRDHKNTALGEAAFATRYFKQQSKRDPPLAVLVQKGVLRRIRRRLPGTRSRPATLEDFCRDVTWQDIIETVEDVLVRDEEAAMRALS